MLTLLPTALAGTSLHAATSQKKKKAAPTASSRTSRPQSTSSPKKASSGKHGAGKSSGTSSRGKTSGHKKKPEASHPAATYQSYVPVPQARSVPKGHEPIDGETAVPTPDMAAEQAQHSYSKASPQAATALTVEDRLAHGQSALHFASALQPFFDALRTREDPQSSNTVRVIQFGDSHTAADMLTGELRSQMQARFGDGSVGFTYAGHPFAGYRILGSGRGESGGWTTLGTHFTQLGDGLLGMGGVAIEAARAGETASLSVNCRTLDVHFLRREGGGSFTVAVNGQVLRTVSTSLSAAEDATSPVEPGVRSETISGTSSYVAPVARSETPSATASMQPQHAGSVTLSCHPGRNDFSFTTNGDGPVRLLGTVSLQPGITWEAAGINGAEAPLILRWNHTLFDTYLAARSPQLIVLAYGTNEAAANWTGEDYRSSFATLIDHLHAVSPDASILVLGPGDRAIAKSSYIALRKGRRARRTYYVPYSGTARILNAQREVCRTHNCAFWDWSARQGGFGSMQRWVAAGYAQPDHTHLTGTGYRALADALFADLMASYSGFERRNSNRP